MPWVTPSAAPTAPPASPGAGGATTAPKSPAAAMCWLATRIKDDTARIFILDTAYETARELIELLKLHIYREDHTLFPLAQKYLSKEEFEEIERKMHKP